MASTLGRSVFAPKADENGRPLAANADRVPRWAMTLTIVIKLLLLPAVGMAAMIGLESLPGGSPLPLNSTMRAVVVLNLASPAASTVIVILQNLKLGSLAEGVVSIYVPMYLTCLA